MRCARVSLLAGWFELLFSIPAISCSRSDTLIHGARPRVTTQGNGSWPRQPGPFMVPPGGGTEATITSLHFSQSPFVSGHSRVTLPAAAFGRRCPQRRQHPNWGEQVTSEPPFLGCIPRVFLWSGHSALPQTPGVGLCLSFHIPVHGDL